MKKFLKLSDSSIYKLARKGKIPAFKIGDSWRFDMDEIVAFVKRKKMIGSDSKMRNKGKAPGLRVRSDEI